MSALVVGLWIWCRCNSSIDVVCGRALLSVYYQARLEATTPFRLDSTPTPPLFFLATERRACRRVEFALTSFF